MQKISNNELNNLSNRVLTFYKIKMSINSDTHSVDVEALAELLGFHVHHVELGPDAELMGVTAFEPTLMDLKDQNGFIVPVAAEKDTIILNNSIKENCIGRYNFTVAHEVAHLILDMVYHLGYRVKYRNKPKLIKSEITYSTYDYEEYIADRLASYILLPYKALRMMFKDSYGKSRIDIISPFDNREHYQSFCKMAEYFGVSREALGIRLQQTGMLGKYYSYQHQKQMDIFPDAQVC